MALLSNPKATVLLCTPVYRWLREVSTDQKKKIKNKKKIKKHDKSTAVVLVSRGESNCFSAILNGYLENVSYLHSVGLMLKYVTTRQQYFIFFIMHGPQKLVRFYSLTDWLTFCGLQLTNITNKGFSEQVDSSLLLSSLYYKFQSVNVHF